ncbi:hypothetical protein ACSSS7_008190 [Eimeria intestinalis]
MKGGRGFTFATLRRYDVLSIDTGMKPLKPEALLRAPAQQPMWGHGDKASGTPPQQQEELMYANGDDPSGIPLRLSPCGCPTSNTSSSSSSSSSRVCCCCCCPKRPVQGIVARWLMLKQQLQRAWEKCLLEGEQEMHRDAAAKHSGGSSSSSSSSSMNGTSSSSSSSSKPAAAAAPSISTFRILVIGGGAVGVEMSFSLQQAVQQLLQSFEERRRQQQQQQQQKQKQKRQQQKAGGDVAEETETETAAGTATRGAAPLKAEIVLITSGPEILTGYPKKTQARAAAIAAAATVAAIAAIAAAADGSCMPCRTPFSAAAAAAIPGLVISWQPSSRSCCCF